jgi:glycosyltransferase involved in cell wall biosynthesis
MNNKIDIIIPCHNEKDNIQFIVDEIEKSTKNISYKIEIIFIDDGSSDGTYECITALSQERLDVRAIKLSRNFGKESAIAAGLSYCNADAAIIIDADLQHPPDLIPILIAEWEKGADIVDAVKKIRQKEWFLKRYMSLVFYKIMNVLTQMDFAGASDYKLLDRKVIQILDSIKEKGRFFRGLTNWIGLSHCKIEFRVDTRKYGKSKWSWVKLFQLSIDAITSYTSKPLQIITILGLFAFGFSVVLGLQTFYNKFFGQAVSGFTTVILITLFLSSIIMISIGILGIYVSKIFNEVKNRPIFIIETNNLSPIADKKIQYSNEQKK